MTVKATPGNSNSSIQMLTEPERKQYNVPETKTKQIIQLTSVQMASIKLEAGKTKQKKSLRLMFTPAVQILHVLCSIFIKWFTMLAIRAEVIR